MSPQRRARPAQCQWITVGPDLTTAGTHVHRRCTRKATITITTRIEDKQGVYTQRSQWCDKHIPEGVKAPA
jgi:hypothetical protein